MCVLLSWLTIDAGLLPPRDAGRRCHDNVPERARLVALGEGCVLRSGACTGLEVDDDVELRAEPKPLNSGMSFVGEGGPGCAVLLSMMGVDDAEGVDGRGVQKVRALLSELRS